MIDFSTVASIEIPGGNVQEIKANGAIIWDSKKRKLPPGYILASYIKSDGSAYISSGIIPDQDTRVICEVDLSPYNGTARNAFGARTSSSKNRYEFGVYNNRYRSTYGTAGPQFAESITTTDFIKVDKNKNVTTINDEHTITSEMQTFTPGYDIVLFGSHTASNVNKSKLAAKYFTIYQNDVLVRDFVSCINPDGEAGMYDFVSNSFFGNSGAGAFTAIIEEV